MDSLTRGMPEPDSGRTLPFLRACVVLCLFLSGQARADVLIESIPGQPLFSFEHAAATDFSGITWAGRSDFYGVSDKKNGIFSMQISIDSSSGRILGATVRSMIAIKTKLSDFEGVAFVPDRRRIYVSAESGNGIFGFDLVKRAVLPVALPQVFSRARKNKSLESLTYDATVGNFWTAGEEAFEGDGLPSGAEQGTDVRLQKFDRRFKPLVQFAYRTEPSGIRMSGAGTGVSDLALLPDGELLVLERVASFTGLSVKIFRVDMTRASDVSKVPRLEGSGIKFAEKKQLFTRATLMNNFEGITLGPRLDGGWRSLLLIADSGGGTTHYLMPLRIRWDGAR